MRETLSWREHLKFIIRSTEFGIGAKIWILSKCIFLCLLADIPVPDHWDPQPKDTNGKDVPLHLVTLDEKNTNHSKEYKKISDGFLKTVPKTSNTILKIQRIQNPFLFKLYALNKQSMDERNGSNEKLLYHGTDTKNIAEINQNGLNRSYNGVNGKDLQI